MHETLKRRILRRLETLPEAQLYQVLDYIEFVESRYSQSEPIAASGLQRLAERLEDGLRSRTLSPSRLREAFQLIGAADRALSSVSEAVQEILSELQPVGESGRSSARPTGDPVPDGVAVSPTETESPERGEAQG